MQIYLTTYDLHEMLHCLATAPKGQNGSWHRPKLYSRRNLLESIGLSPASPCHAKDVVRHGEAWLAANRPAPELHRKDEEAAKDPPPWPELAAFVERKKAELGQAQAQAQNPAPVV